MMMAMETFSILITGIGGQGVMWLSKVIAHAASSEYPFVCRTESRGLSQRGGGVCSCVRFGHKAVTPVAGSGFEDLVLSLDALEAVRALPMLKPSGLILTHEEYRPPTHLLEQWRTSGSEIAGQTKLKRQLDSALDEWPGAIRINLRVHAENAGAKSLNTVMLGAASHVLSIGLQALHDALAEAVPSAARLESLRAFEEGRAALVPSLMGAAILADAV